MCFKTVCLFSKVNAVGSALLNPAVTQLSTLSHNIERSVNVFPIYNSRPKYRGVVNGRLCDSFIDLLFQLHNYPIMRGICLRSEVRLGWISFIASRDHDE